MHCKFLWDREVPYCAWSSEENYHRADVFAYMWNTKFHVLRLFIFDVLITWSFRMPSSWYYSSWLVWDAATRQTIRANRSRGDAMYFYLLFINRPSRSSRGYWVEGTPWGGQVGEKEWVPCNSFSNYWLRANVFAGILRLPPSYDLRNLSLYEDLVKKRQEVLASKFCDLMTINMTLKSHNGYRVGFYNDVIFKVNFRVLHRFSEDDRSF